MSVPTGQYAQALASLMSQLQNESAGGSVDLTNRPRVSPTQMAQGGYDIGDGYATTYTGTYSNPDGSVAANFTPIQYSGGKLQAVHPEAFMQNYAEGVLAGQPDTLGLQIGGNFYGNDAIQRADNAAQRQHNLQETYAALRLMAGLQ
jgi:hypothetical protein